MQMVNVRNGEWIELTIGTSSKGNQRKWLNKRLNKYLKEQFYFQDKYWKDYRCEVLASKLGSNLGVIKQEECTILDSGSITYGVISDNFLGEVEELLTFSKILKISGIEVSKNIFPMELFELLRDTVKEFTNVDCTEYLLTALVLDYVLMNEDRHLSNLCIIYNTFTHECRVVKLFDFGLSLFEHDKKYMGKSVYQAMMYADFKPYYVEPRSVIMQLARYYKSEIEEIVSRLVDISREEFPSELAKDYYNITKESWGDIL